MQAWLSVNLEADLRSVFSWNTKQLFVAVVASFSTPKNHVNEAVIWTDIIAEKVSMRLARILQMVWHPHLMVMRLNFAEAIQHNLSGTHVSDACVANETISDFLLRKCLPNWLHICCLMHVIHFGKYIMNTVSLKATKTFHQDLTNKGDFSA